MPAQKNVDYVQKVKEKLNPAKGFYFTDFTGMSVQELEGLRRALRKNNASYLVLKNTLGFIALKDLGFKEESIRDLFVGPTGIAIALGDPVTLAKILTDTENLKIKGGFVEGSFFNSQKVTEFSKIPSREILYGYLIGSINIISHCAGTLESLIRNLIYTIAAVKDKEAK